MWFDSAQALWASIVLCRIVIVIDVYLVSFFSQIYNNLFMIFLGHTMMSMVASGWLCTMTVCNQFAGTLRATCKISVYDDWFAEKRWDRQGDRQTIKKVLGWKRWQEPPMRSRFDIQRGRKNKQTVMRNFNDLSKLSWNLKIGHNHRYSHIILVCVCVGGGGGSFLCIYIFLLKVLNSVGRGYYCTL